ncbi:Hypothetical predicted protein [Mytilus galloprovincialis]|uniref:Uncharacterized protein n=1 Tax=Mytilus galloprovincialis TaxID=29158 RepID=A0A8B6BT48_MYTGA|nr:Hypothetical predicted protein [Mytilus galloprovincialis]
MQIRQKSSPCSDRVFKMGNTTIEYTPRYRYLGLTIYETLEFNECVNELITASSRAFGALSSYYFLVDGYYYDTNKTLFTSTVVPIMDYASGVWASKYSGVGCDGQIILLASLKSDDADLLLSEIGLLNTYRTEDYTICGEHLKYIKEENCLSWIRRKCCIPFSISAHKSVAKGDRKITKDVMYKILTTTGCVVPIGARK